MVAIKSICPEQDGVDDLWARVPETSGFIQEARWDAGKCTCCVCQPGIFQNARHAAVVDERHSLGTRGVFDIMADCLGFAEECRGGSTEFVICCHGRYVRERRRRKADQRMPRG